MNIKRFRLFPDLSMPFLYGENFYPLKLNSRGALMLSCVACFAMNTHPRY